MKLNAKQQLFVEEYLVDLNATQAAIRAGYSKKTAKEMGYENLTKPHIADAIVKAKDKRSKRTQIDSDYVLNCAVKLHNRCTGDEQVLDQDGEPVKDKKGVIEYYPFNAQGSGKAIELMGKHINVRAWDEKPQIDLSVTIKRDLNDFYSETDS